jgi:hypothetical protein
LEEEMSSGNVRKGVTQARFNENVVNFLFGEILIISALFGFGFGSWYVFGGVLFGLMIVFMIPKLNVLVSILFSIGWALIVSLFACAANEVELTSYVGKLEADYANIGLWFDLVLQLFSIPASQVSGGIAFVVGMGLHLSGIEWVGDVGDGDDRNV